MRKSPYRSGGHGKLIGLLDIGDDVGGLKQRARLDRAQTHRPVGPPCGARRRDHVELDIAAQRMSLQGEVHAGPELTERGWHLFEKRRKFHSASSSRGAQSAGHKVTEGLSDCAG